MRTKSSASVNEASRMLKPSVQLVTRDYLTLFVGFSACWAVFLKYYIVPNEYLQQFLYYL